MPPKSTSSSSTTADLPDDDELVIAPQPFLVNCVVNTVNNVRVMVDPTQPAAATSWNRLSEYTSPRVGASRTNLVGSNLPASSSLPADLPKSRLEFDPSRYLHVAASSQLDAAHPALGEIATRFNGKYEIHCVMTAPTMFHDMDFEQQAQEVIPARPSNVKLAAKKEVLEAGGKFQPAMERKYAALLRMVFDHDPLESVEKARERESVAAAAAAAAREQHESLLPASEIESSPPSTGNNSFTGTHLSSGDQSHHAAAAADSTSSVATAVASATRVVKASAAPNDDSSSDEFDSVDNSPSRADSADTAIHNLQIPMSQPIFWSTTTTAPGIGSSNNNLSDNEDTTTNNNGEYELIHRLGPVHILPPIESALFVTHLPKSMSLIICEVDTDELEPADILLARTVRDLLEADEYRGSFPSSHIQNMVRGFVPCYSDVVGSVADAVAAREKEASAAGASAAAAESSKTTTPTIATTAATVDNHPPGVGIYDCWSDFVDAHSGIEWGCFRYTKQMLLEMGVGGEASGGGGSGWLCDAEPRLVAWPFMEKFMEADAAREKHRLRCEAEVREHIKTEVGKRPHSPAEIAKLLSQSRAFLSTMSPHFGKMLDMIEEDPRYAVLRDRLHPIMIEANVDVGLTMEVRAAPLAVSRRGDRAAPTSSVGGGGGRDDDDAESDEDADAALNAPQQAYEKLWK